QLLQRLNIGHGEVDAAGNHFFRLLRIVEVVARFELLFIIAEIFEAEFLRLCVEVLELSGDPLVASDRVHASSLRRPAGRPSRYQRERVRAHWPSSDISRRSEVTMDLLSPGSF